MPASKLSNCCRPEQWSKYENIPWYYGTQVNSLSILTRQNYLKTKEDGGGLVVVVVVGWGVGVGGGGGGGWTRWTEQGAILNSSIAPRGSGLLWPSDITQPLTSSSDATSSVRYAITVEVYGPVEYLIQL